jgi:uroporphyrinogen-III synthase
MYTYTKKKRVILFKKQDNIDEYNDLFLKNNYIPQFIPVLDHKSENINSIKNIILKGPQQNNFTGLILTSQRSVQAMSEALETIEITEEITMEWNSLPAYIVGPQTAKALHELPLFKGHINDKQHWIVAPRAAELIDLIIHHQKKLHQPKILFLAGDKRRDLIPDGLKSANLEFHEIQSYATCPHSDLKKSIENLPTADWLVYFSPSGLKFILSSIDAVTKEKFLATSATLHTAAIGPTTADYIIEELGLTPHVMAEKPDAQHLVNAIIQFDASSSL